MKTCTNLDYIPDLLIPEGKEIKTSHQILAVRKNGEILPYTQRGQLTILHRKPYDPRNPTVLYAAENVSEEQWVSAIATYARYEPQYSWMVESAGSTVEAMHVVRNTRVLQQGRHTACPRTMLSQADNSGLQQVHSPGLRLSTNRETHGEAAGNQVMSRLHHNTSRSTAGSSSINSYSKYPSTIPSSPSLRNIRTSLASLRINRDNQH